MHERVQKLIDKLRAMALSCLVLLLFFFIQSLSLSYSSSVGADVQLNKTMVNGGTDYRDVLAGIVIFGDSTVDVGNNNFLLTPVRCDWEPYGRIFEGGLPTGRFCDGKLAVDIVIEKVGYPLPLPYLAPNAHGEAILTGINFASSASGWYDATASRFNVKTLGEQIQWFANWQKEVISVAGAERGDYILKKTLYIISTGANDWVNNYQISPTLQKQYTQEAYTTFIIGKARNYIQELYDLGAHNIAILGLPPLGCIPAQITLHGHGKPGCVEWMNTLTLNFNHQFKCMMEELQLQFHDGHLVYLDSYGMMQDIIKNPHAYGITETRKGCCGTGLIETGPACNSHSDVCQDGNSYLWWDGFHPTEHANYFLGESLFQQAVAAFLGPKVP